MSFTKHLAQNKIPFGQWESIVSAALIAKNKKSLQEMHAGTHSLYWVETRPEENARCALMRLSLQGKIEEVSQVQSVRSRVYEYGGGAFAVQNDDIYYSDGVSQALAFLNGATSDVSVLQNPEKMRYADITIHPLGWGLAYIKEDHSTETVQNSVCWYYKGQEVTVASGCDCYASPRFSPDGKSLAFISWNFPNMPWDGCELSLASVSEPQKIIIVQKFGGQNESICQVSWSPDNCLYFVSDKTGWWNLYSFSRDQALQPLFEAPLSFGMPQWNLGKLMYTFIPKSQTSKEYVLALTYIHEGRNYFAFLDPKIGLLEKEDMPFSQINDLCTFDGKAFFLGSGPATPPSIVSIDFSTRRWTIVYSAQKDVGYDQSWISSPEALTYPSKTSGTGYAFYYPPKNPLCTAPEGTLPPLLVRCHGGPNAAAPTGFDARIHFWTSRGFAVLDVNYTGSSGFGREYMQNLQGKWGLADVADCIAAAEKTVQMKKADPHKLVVNGGSSGGLTALGCLFQSKTFAAGTSYYGVTDLVTLVQKTHKFEEHYINLLVAKYPEGIDLLKQRSPFYNVEKITAPTLFLQGEEDFVVPPEQSQQMHDKLQEHGIFAKILLFPGEAHGFRLSSTIEKALSTELDFYLQVLDATKRPPE